MVKAKQRWLYLGILVLVILVILLVVGRHSEGKQLSIEQCGAVADDGKDDLTAIQNCIKKAESQHLSLYVPEGQFQISDLITLNGVSMRGAGEKSILVSTNPERGSINIQGDGVKLSDLQHQYQSTVERGDGANEKNSITVSHARNFLIDHVRITKATAAGIMVTGGASDGTITNNIVEHTGADGIHMTGESSHIVVEGNQVKEAGDDTIAVVSYKEDGSAVQDITIKNNDVGYQSQARGISVVGGKKVAIEGNNIQETSMAGIYIATEQNWNSDNTSDITVSKNIVDHTGTRAGSDHPNILVYASYGELDDITFTENQIINAAHAGIGIWGDGIIGNIYLEKNRVENSNLSPTQFKKGSIHSTNNIGF